MHLVRPLQPSLTRESHGRLRERGLPAIIPVLDVFEVWVIGSEAVQMLLHVQKLAFPVTGLVCPSSHSVLSLPSLTLLDDAVALLFFVLPSIFTHVYVVCMFAYVWTHVWGVYVDVCVCVCVLLKKKIFDQLRDEEFIQGRVIYSFLGTRFQNQQPRLQDVLGPA